MCRRETRSKVSWGSDWSHPTFTVRCEDATIRLLFKKTCSTKYLTSSRWAPALAVACYWADSCVCGFRNCKCCLLTSESTHCRWKQSLTTWEVGVQLSNRAFPILYSVHLQSFTPLVYLPPSGASLGGCFIAMLALSVSSAKSASFSAVPLASLMVVLISHTSVPEIMIPRTLMTAQEPSKITLQRSIKSPLTSLPAPNLLTAAPPSASASITNWQSVAVALAILIFRFGGHWSMVVLIPTPMGHKGSGEGRSRGGARGGARVVDI